jgi:hypothetical protein
MDQVLQAVEEKKEDFSRGFSLEVKGIKRRIEKEIFKQWQGSERFFRSLRNHVGLVVGSVALTFGGGTSGPFVGDAIGAGHLDGRGPTQHYKRQQHWCPLAKGYGIAWGLCGCNEAVTRIVNSSFGTNGTSHHCRICSG